MSVSQSTSLEVLPGLPSETRAGCKASSRPPSTVFDMADSWWEAGARSAEDAQGYEPVFLDLKASLRLAQRRSPEAIRLLDKAVHLFLHGEQPDRHLPGRSLISKVSYSPRWGLLRIARHFFPVARSPSRLLDLEVLVAARPPRTAIISAPPILGTPPRQAISVE
jgi:hypothetical protein